MFSLIQMKNLKKSSYTLESTNCLVSHIAVLPYVFLINMNKNEMNIHAYAYMYIHSYIPENPGWHRHLYPSVTEASIQSPELRHGLLSHGDTAVSHLNPVE